MFPPLESALDVFDVLGTTGTGRPTPSCESWQRLGLQVIIGHFLGGRKKGQALEAKNDPTTPKRASAEAGSVDAIGARFRFGVHAAFGGFTAFTGMEHRNAKTETEGMGRQAGRP